MVYAKGQATDEKLHAVYHSNALEGIRFQVSALLQSFLALSIALVVEIGATCRAGRMNATSAAPPAVARSLWSFQMIRKCSATRQVHTALTATEVCQYHL